MSSFGVTNEGFVQKTTQDVKSDMEQRLRGLIGDRINLLSNSSFGGLVGVTSIQEGEDWQVLADIYRSGYASSATGQSLIELGELTGAFPLVPLRSTVTLSLNLNAGATVPALSVVSISGTLTKFRTKTGATNSEAFNTDVLVEAESVDFGPVVGVSGTIDQIDTPEAGWLQSVAVQTLSSEPYTLADLETLDVSVDGGLVQTVTFMTADFADIANATASEVSAQVALQISGVSAIDAGGFARITNTNALAGNSLEITGGTAATGLGFQTGIKKGMNPLDAQVGRINETDEEFRIRREELLEIQSSGTVEGIRASIRSVTGVGQAFVFNNPTAVAVGGIPPHSYESVVSAPTVTDEDIAQAIFQVGPAGIEPFGTTVVPITNSQGDIQSIGFSRATDIDMYIEVEVERDPDVFGGGGLTGDTEGIAQIKAALVSLGDTLQVGEDVNILSFRCVPLGVSGVIDVPTIKIEDIFPPVNTSNIAVALKDVAKFDTSRITVVIL